jgi:hypothetical protein
MVNRRKDFLVNNNQHVVCTNRVSGAEKLEVHVLCKQYLQHKLYELPLCK